MRERSNKYSNLHLLHFLDKLRAEKSLQHVPLPDINFLESARESFLANPLPIVIYANYYPNGTFPLLEGNVEDILGYPRNYVKELGIKFVHEHIHPADREILFLGLFPNLVLYLKEIDDEQLPQWKFSFNYRLRRADKSWMHLLQQFSIILRDKERNPLMQYGIAVDITHHKTDNTVTFSAVHYQEGGVTSFHKVNFQPECSIFFTNREREILNLMLKGKSSKQIADELFISVSTVNNHRQNMLAKTESKNTAELLNKALLNGLLG